MNSAKSLGSGPRPQLIAWFHHHRQAAADSLAKMAAEPLATLLTWLVVGIALALPASLLIALDNIAVLTEAVDAPSQFSLFLAPDTSAAEAAELAGEVDRRAGVAEAELVLRDEALTRFAADTGLGGLVATLEENPLPHTILVRTVGALGDSRDSDALAESLARLPGVADVIMDTRWLERLEAVVTLGQRIVAGIGVLMVAGAVLILGNTIRLAIEARREEIVVIKLIGASNGFARRPFLYTGLWFGVGGGVTAAIMVAALLWLAAAPVGTLMRLYDAELALAGLSPVGVLNLVLLGGGLGLLSAWQTTALHLRRVEPA